MSTSFGPRHFPRPILPQQVRRPGPRHNSRCACESRSRISADAVRAQGARFAGDQPVAQADEEVADVDRLSHAVYAVQRGAAVAELVVVLDVVVDQRGLVQGLDRQGERRIGRGIIAPVASPQSKTAAPWRATA